jgi:SAM-dependent methyltransferase
LKDNTLDKILNENITKIVISSPTNVAGADGRVYNRVDIIRGANKFQASMYTKKQVFHKILLFEDIKPFVESLFGVCFMQIHTWCGDFEYSAKISKKGKILMSHRKIQAISAPKAHGGDNFNKQKNYIISEGADVPALYDMGVFTKNGKVAAPMQDKFRQINRFLELIADEVKPGKIDEDTTVNIIDFGCGKSYLTFVLYHYFTKIRGLKVNICGLDLMEDVIEKCSEAARKYGYDNLEFKIGDIGSQPVPPVESWGQAGTFNIVICLHACDTATDQALYNAIKWQADLIYAVPCCQKEFNGQMDPQNLSIFAEYGVIKERMAALATDAVRAKLLEYTGYKAQVLEFVDFDATPKNLLIRARRAENRPRAAKDKAMAETEALMAEFSFKPALLGLLQEAL